MEEVIDQEYLRVLWHVIHAKPRCEKKIAEYCRTNGLNHYLPLSRETKIYQRRKVSVDKPLFPGYVFAAFNRVDRLGLLKTQYAVRLLEVVDQDRLVRELDQVRLALETDPYLSPCSSVTKGDMVRIKTGPFEGIEGVVTRIKGVSKVILNVHSISQGIVLETATDMLEKL